MATRRNVLLMFGLTGLALTVCPVARSSADAWAVYVNARFGTRVRYPVSLFTPGPAPENDDGRTFAAPDGARLLIFGRYNALDETLSSMKASLTGPQYADTTYRAAGSGWFVVSGYRDIDGVPSIFYEKYMLSPDAGTVHTMILTYPASARARYDAIAGEVARSLGAAVK